MQNMKHLFVSTSFYVFYKAIIRKTRQGNIDMIGIDPVANGAHVLNTNIDMKF